MRGELKLMENVIAFFMIIVIGMIALIFFSISQHRSNQQDAAAEETMRAIQIARSLYNLPELSCTSSQSGRCIDSLKAEKFSEIIEGSYLGAYLSTFGRSNITIRYLSDPDTQEVPVYGLLDSNSYRQFQLPVNVYDPENDTTHFGWIEVRV